MADTRKEIPTSGAKNFPDRVREEVMRLMGKMGNPLDRAVTMRDLQAAGIVKLRESFLNGGNTIPIQGPGAAIGAEEPDLTPPPTPSGFTLAAAISHVFAECGPQVYTQGHGHAETVLYGITVADGAPLPTFSDAVELATFQGTVYAYPTNPALTWRMWIKWRSKDGVLSTDPAGGINGLEVKTGQDVALLVKAMTGPGNPFKIVSAPITLPDGTVVPEGTYTSDAYIHRMQVVNAMIRDLAVDNAKVANMAVDKLTAGSLNIGAYIQSTNYVGGSSGWRINGAGFAEFSGVIVRGTVVASAGAIGGIIINATSLRSSNYNGTVGFAINSDGTLDLPNGSIFASKLSVVNLAAVSSNLGSISTGAITLNQDGGGGWGFFRTPGKWLNDGVQGIVLARHADGSVFWDFTANNVKFFGYNLNPQGGGEGAVIDFAGAFYADSTGYMEVRRANVIDTVNINGNAVTVPAAASGSARANAVNGAPINDARLIIGSYNARGAPVIVTVSATMMIPPTSGGGDADPTVAAAVPMLIRLWRGGSQVAQRDAALGGCTFYITDWPDSAADIWATFEPAPPGGGVHYVYSRVLTLIGCRR